ncbi:hypothetical protein [Asticcacaulis sp.]|uniref:hypothetical protein n=1 Tax=Asticcacaulis sp. TaxID=1872648 RepID=UPI002613B3FD|nr:hypothetical protein [Asticcacaulis sp.]
MSFKIFYVIAGGEPRYVSTLHRLFCALGITNSADYWNHKEIAALSKDVSDIVPSVGELDDISPETADLSNFDTVFTQRAVEALDAAFTDCEKIAVNLSDIGALSGFWLRAFQASGGQVVSIFEVSAPENLTTNSFGDAGEKFRTWLKAIVIANTLAEKGGGIFLDYATLLESWIERLDDVERITKTRLPDLSEESYQQVESLILRRRIEFAISKPCDTLTAPFHPFADMVHQALLRATKNNQKVDADVIKAIERYLNDSRDYVSPPQLDLVESVDFVEPIKPTDVREAAVSAEFVEERSIPEALGEDEQAKSDPISEISGADRTRGALLPDDKLVVGAEFLKKPTVSVLKTDLIVSQDSDGKASELLEEIRDLSRELSFYSERKIELERELYRLQEVNLKLQEENRTLLESVLANNKIVVSQPVPQMGGSDAPPEAREIEERMAIAERERDAAQERIDELSSEVIRLQQYADSLQAGLSHSTEAVEARAIRAEEAYNGTVQRLREVEQHVRNVEADREKTVASLREALEHEVARASSIDHERGIMAARVAELSLEIMRIQSFNEQNMVSRDVYVDATEKLNLLEQEVLTLRQEKLDAAPLLREREAILASNSWKLTALPRAILTVFRTRK